MAYNVCPTLVPSTPTLLPLMGGCAHPCHPPYFCLQPGPCFSCATFTGRQWTCCWGTWPHPLPSRQASGGRRRSSRLAALCSQLGGLVCGVLVCAGLVLLESDLGSTMQKCRSHAITSVLFGRVLIVGLSVWMPHSLVSRSACVSALQGSMAKQAVCDGAAQALPEHPRGNVTLLPW